MTMNLRAAIFVALMLIRGNEGKLSFFLQVKKSETALISCIDQILTSSNLIQLIDFSFLMPNVILTDLQSNGMGCVNAGDANILNKKTLTVATLNYCGIMNSPFEFYCEQYEIQLKDISNIFASLIPKYFPSFVKEKFKWEMGKVDLKIRVGRYSPMFKAQTGIENGKFLSRSEFQAKWEEVFQNQCKKANFQCQEKDKEGTKLYDLIAYHTLLKYVYKIDAIDQALNKDPQIYLKTIRPFFQLSFLNQQRKVKKMVDNLAKLQADVFFFQEYSEYFYNYIVNRREHIISYDQTKDTLIIAKEASFSKLKDIEVVFSKLNKQQRDNLNWAQRSAFVCLDNYIFISAHLSSKEQKNKPQIQQLKKGLIELRAVLPQYDIIFGGDINSFLPPFSKDFYVYPESEQVLTTIKKRTMTQGQFHKAEKVVQESKDKIITTLKIQSAHTMYISGRIPEKDNYVPTNEHPFDHFVLVANIKKRNDVIL